MEHQGASVRGPAITTLLDSISDGVLIVDRTWRVTYANGQGAVLARRPRADLLGRTCWEVFPEFVGTAVETQARAALAEETVTSLDYDDPAGAACFHVRFSPADDGLLVIFQDITARKQAIEAQQASEEWLRQATEAAGFPWAPTRSVASPRSAGPISATTSSTTRR